MADQLEYYFGEESRGATFEERARTSTRVWVRSQNHLSLDKPSATGKKMTAWEVYSIFGLEKMQEAFDYGSAVIVSGEDEPAGTITRRRLKLGLSQGEVARRAGISIKDVEKAENVKKVSYMKILEKICDVLGLDALKLSWIPDALKEGVEQ